MTAAPALTALEWLSGILPLVKPADAYNDRLRSREQETQRLHGILERFGYARLGVALLTLLAAGYCSQSRAFSAWWLLPAVAVFVALVICHQRARQRHARAERAVSFYRQGLARIEDRWAGQGQTGSEFESAQHVYAADLDLFGAGSLFELLCIARTRMGQHKLAQWLLEPADLAQIRQRHGALADLAPRMDLREELACSGEHSNVGVNPAALLDWAQRPNELTARWLPVVSVLLPILAVLTGLVWWLTGNAVYVLSVLLIEAAVLATFWRKVEAILRGTETAFEDLRLFSELLLRVERERFNAPALTELQGRIRSQARAASATVASLATIVSLAGSRRNQMLAVFAVPLLYALNVALVAERWRERHGHVVHEWLEALADFEALSCIACYAFEHPEDPLPQFEPGAPIFAAARLGHPLIPAARCVRNDVSIEGRTRVLLISGSNMSGKSTLLRTVGINTVLAMAGAPVRADSLRLSALQIGASIRLNDSLQEGNSRFYAEITRLRQLFDLLKGPRPLLYLLDELLQGTNSHDRRSGAEGIIRALVEGGAIGCISTHDLSLTQIPGLEEGELRNVHFQDELVAGHMEFDFTLRDGVVTRSNAMELMRSIGLKV